MKKLLSTCRELSTCEDKIENSAEDALIASLKIFYYFSKCNDYLCLDAAFVTGIWGRAIISNFIRHKFWVWLQQDKEIQISARICRRNLWSQNSGYKFHLKRCHLPILNFWCFNISHLLDFPISNRTTNPPSSSRLTAHQIFSFSSMPSIFSYSSKTSSLSHEKLLPTDPYGPRLFLCHRRNSIFSSILSSQPSSPTNLWFLSL